MIVHNSNHVLLGLFLREAMLIKCTVSAIKIENEVRCLIMLESNDILSFIRDVLFQVKFVEFLAPRSRVRIQKIFILHNVIQNNLYYSHTKALHVQIRSKKSSVHQIFVW